MRVNKKKCTHSIEGIIVELKRKGMEFPTIMTVQYIVEGSTYTIKESVKLKSKAIKIGFFPIGQKKMAVMNNVKVGASTIVMYNPEKPEEAYVRDNVGRMNC